MCSFQRSASTDPALSPAVHVHASASRTPNFSFCTTGVLVTLLRAHRARPPTHHHTAAPLHRRTAAGAPQEHRCTAAPPQDRHTTAPPDRIMVGSTVARDCQGQPWRSWSCAARLGRICTRTASESGDPGQRRPPGGRSRYRFALQSRLGAVICDRFQSGNPLSYRFRVRESSVVSI